MSASLAAKSGSLERLKVRMRCGCRSCAAQIRCTERREMPAVSAIARPVQWVASPGGLILEVPGESHTLVSEHPDGVKLFGWMQGPIEFYDDDANYVDTADVWWFINHYETYCREQGTAFIPWFPLGGGDVKDTKVVQQVAARHQASVRQLALSWLLHHAPNILPIPGTRSIDHLEENMRAAALQLTTEDMQALDSIG